MSAYYGQFNDNERHAIAERRDRRPTPEKREVALPEQDEVAAHGCIVISPEDSPCQVRTG